MSSELNEFLKKYSYRSIGTASPMLLMSYIAQLEKLADGDPFVARTVTSLKTTPINQIPQKLALLEEYLKQQFPKSFKNQKGKKN